MNDNNNLNGTVLGSVDPNGAPIPNPQPLNNPSGGVENLNQPVPPVQPVSPVQPMSNPIPREEVNPTPVSPGPVNVPPAPMPSAPVEGPNPANVPPVTPEVVPPVTPVMPNANPGMPEPLPVTPEPAYTNPNTIGNPNGMMPGFESANNIGTTPPISFEPEKKPEKKTNKLVFIIIILVVLAAVGFGTFYVLKYTDLLNNKVAKISIEPKNFEVNLGDELPSTNGDYATVTGTDIASCGVDTSEVDTSKVGEYTYTITCGETHRQGKVSVVDNSVLEVALKTVYKSKNESLEAKEFATSDDSSLTYEFVSEDEVKSLLSGEAGTKTVKIKVTNESGKSIEVEGTLVVLDYVVKGFITCSKEETLADNKTMVTSERFAIADLNGENSNDFANIIYEEIAFKFNDRDEYNNLVEEYQANKTITVNNITSDEIKFDDLETNPTITFKAIKNVEDAEKEYGKDNLAKYSTIKSYFETNLKYTCSYKKVETTTNNNNQNNTTNSTNTNNTQN